MTTDRPVADPSQEVGRSWRELAVARSLDSARTRAENRVQRFMDAALELVNASDGTDFTVQEVVERSGQSLRSFYQYFDGKHELVLALFEESVASTVELLRERVARERGPMDRLHCFVVEYHQLCRPSRNGSSPVSGSPPILTEFAWQLLTERPKEAARAFAPLVSMYWELFDDAVAAGLVRPDRRSSSLTGTILAAIMFNAFSSSMGDAPTRDDDRNAAQELWELILYGIVDGPPT